MRILKFIICLTLLTTAAPVTAQDTTITAVADGFIHYHIFDPSGPFNINVLEIDVSNPDNKIGAGLANDVMAHGFERTSSLSKRKSESGNIVVGAINGDFYGIADPQNPYGYLSSSMIMQNEFVFGREFHRSLFGVVDGNQPVIDVLDFNGVVTVNDDASFTFNRFNAQRVGDSMVLFNRFFGSSTLTNEYGIEVRLQPIDEIAVNTPVQFRVDEIEKNIGDMEIDQDIYILSGHGTASEFLETNIEEDDTITITMGTLPDRNRLSALVGGGPRLLTDGTRPDNYTGVEHFGSNFIETRHPRTAVGFNADSTIVYFVTVDGRQPGLSAGMSLYELADFMISFGISDAVNLDGGGSTTMVVHNHPVNSPSDPGGERSVANALLAISTIQLESPARPLLSEPGDQAVDQPDTVILSWNPVEDAVHYSVEVSLDDDFGSDLVYEETIFMDTLTVLTGIEGLTDYYWRVQAHNAVGISEQSDVFSFTTGFPPVPALEGPDHGNTDVPVSPLFEWEEIDVAAQYRIQIAYGRSFSEALMVHDTTVAAPSLEYEGELDYDETHFWRVRAINEFGRSDWSEVFGFRTTTPTSVEQEERIPESYKLKPNYPNPFNPNTTIAFALPERDHIIIEIYTVNGEKIGTMVDDHFEAGIHTVEWNAAGFASGVYYCTMHTRSGFTSTEKMVLIR